MYFVFDSIPDQYKTQEISGIVVSSYYFYYNIALININLKECVMQLLMIL